MMDADETFLTEIDAKVTRDILGNRQLSALVHVSQSLNRSHKAIIHTIDVLFPESSMELP